MRRLRWILIGAMALACLVPTAAQAKPGDVLIADTNAGSPGIIRVYDPATGALTVLAQGAPLADPQDLVVGPDGFVYVADISGAVHRIDPATGAITTIAQGAPLQSARGLDFGPQGELYVTDSGSNLVVRVDTATGAATPFSAGPPFIDPWGIVFARDGFLYVTDRASELVHRIDRGTGVATVFVQQPTLIDEPMGMDQDPVSGLLYFADGDANGVFTVDPVTAQLTILGAVPQNAFSDFAFGPTDLFGVDESTDNLNRVDRSTGLRTPLLPVGALVNGQGLTVEPPKCAGKTATIVGTEGADTITGTDFADVISVLGGKDRVSARKGKDIVCGGKGKDRLNGGAGKDKLRGEAGKDRLAGGKGNDTCAGGKGDDSGKGCEKGKV